MEFRCIGSSGFEARSENFFFQETIIYLETLGIHVNRKLVGFTTRSEFVPRAQIKDVVICERIEDFGIVHCLLILVENEDPLDVFVKCPPTLMQLKPLYNFIQARRDGTAQEFRPRFVSIAARKKIFQERKADFKRKQAQVTAKVEGAKNLARERISLYRENIVTIPNLLSVTRIMCTPLLGYWVCTGAYGPALGLFGFAAVSDLLDGQIARRWPSQQSMAGTLLDPLADKFLVGTLFLTLTYAQIIPLSLTLLIVCRDVGLMGGSFYLRYKSLPKPKTLSRFFDPTLASMKFQPTCLSKANTTIQLLLVACSLGAPVFDFVAHPCLHVLWWVTATTTFGSGLQYALRRDTYRFLHQRSLGEKIKPDSTFKESIE